jgi:hypothetical protein
VAEGARLESVYTARYPGFESLSLRQITTQWKPALPLRKRHSDPLLGQNLRRSSRAATIPAPVQPLPKPSDQILCLLYRKEQGPSRP